ncbi:MAG: methylmalonyl-CoA epimerase [Acidobacteria bacterium]|nr:methylmalonyl-CoA epimerase [Acidobacteriota bacterium]
MNSPSELDCLQLGPLDHVAVAVRDIDTAAKRYSALGLRIGHREQVGDQGVEVAFLEADGTATLELVCPTSPDSPIVAFLDRRGESLHHICFRVEDIDAALAAARRAELRLIDDVPRAGAKGSRIAFIHPEVTGVLIELKQPA